MWLAPSSETPATTRAAQVDSAKEPKRSAPMPAMSPTLSPTLSAQTEMQECKEHSSMLNSCAASNRNKRAQTCSHAHASGCASAAHVGLSPQPHSQLPLHPSPPAMTAGLRGSSSGMSFSTLPTRSAPTSAACRQQQQQEQRQGPIRSGTHRNYASSQTASTHTQPTHSHRPAHGNPHANSTTPTATQHNRLYSP